MGNIRSLSRLSAKFVKHVKDPGKYADGGGLWLQVHGPTSKSWIFRYRLDGRERELGLGPAADITLVEAREAAAEARRMKLSGVDPIDARRGLKAGRQVEEPLKQVTFDEAATAYIRSNQAGWKNAKHGAQWQSTLTAYATPVFGKRPVAEIDRPLVLKALEPIWATKSETASRVRGRIESILDWATVMGYRSGDNPARWKGNLDKVLPARSRVRSVQHHRALAYAEMPEFVANLQGQTGVAAQALAFTILTAGRTSEILSARWEEVDLEAKLWTIPASRMKAGKKHRVPLTSAALDILDCRGSGKRAGLIFPHPTTASALSINAMRSVLLRMKVDVTVHGFRSAFRDWAAEKTSHANEVVEMALAHAIGSQVEAAYRRGDLLQKRTALMDDWSKYLRDAAQQ